MDNLLEYFIREPEREFHVRELAKLVKKSPTTVSKYLTIFKKKNLLNSRKKLNHLLFKANIVNSAFKDLKFSYNLRKLRGSGLLDYLNKKFNYPEAIVLFGSFKKAEDIIGSDIDILIITPLKKNIDLIRFEKILDHKIQLFMHSRMEINKMKIKNKELLNNFVNGVVLEGFWEIFK